MIKSNKTLIAVDGPAATGKGSLARKLAQQLDLEYIDTGKLYRKLATQYHKIIRQELSDQSIIDILSSEHSGNLSSDHIGIQASALARNHKIRKMVTEISRKMAHESKNGAILDGRDVGSTILPDANCKLYITAKPFIRAERRFKELKKARRIAYKQILFKLIQRDIRDSHRTHSPLQKTEDASIIDNSFMNLEETLLLAQNIIRKKCPGCSSSI